MGCRASADAADEAARRGAPALEPFGRSCLFHPAAEAACCHPSPLARQPGSPAGADDAGLTFAGGYEAKGATETVGGVSCYISGVGGRCVVVLADAFGAGSGRHRQLCDRLGREGFLAVMPDLLAGDELAGGGALLSTAWRAATGRAQAWARRNGRAAVAPQLAAVLRGLSQRGVGRVGVVSFCWGAYPGFLLSAEGAVRCHVSFYPSVAAVCCATKEDEAEIVRQVRCPQLIVATGGIGGEPARWRPGGAVHKRLAAKGLVDGWELAKQPHGWMTRADASRDPAARVAVVRGFRLTVRFLLKHLGSRGPMSDAMLSAGTRRSPASCVWEVPSCP